MSGQIFLRWKAGTIKAGKEEPRRNHVRSIMNVKGGLSSRNERAHREAWLIGGTQEDGQETLN